jgi:hypothetical protein
MPTAARQETVARLPAPGTDLAAAAQQQQQQAPPQLGAYDTKLADKVWRAFQRAGGSRGFVRFRLA